MNSNNNLGNYCENSENNKYLDYMIISQKNHSSPNEWAQGIFQTFEPISGNFKIGDNFFGNMMCVNNQTGRGYYANPCGYWDNANEQFNSGTIKSNITMKGALFPTNKISNNVVTNPNDRLVFGYARIGEEFRSR